LIFVFFFILFLMVIKKISKKLILTFFLIFLFLMSLFISVLIYSSEGRSFMSEQVRILDISSAESLVDNFTTGRLEYIKSDFQEVIKKNDYLLIFIGFGKGYVGEVHNQYLRNFIETGIIGSIIFLFLIFSILKESFRGFCKGKDSLKVALSAGLLTATFMMIFSSFATEPFIVVKPSEVYWFFAGITFVVLLNNSKIIKEHEQKLVR